MAKLTKITAIALIFALGVLHAGIAWAATADVSKLVLSKNELTLEIGDAYSLSATAVYTDGSTANVTINANWSSDATSVATVYNGTVTAKGEGTATIIASFGGIPQSVHVVVSKKVKALTKDKQSLDLRNGQTATIGLKAIYSDNSSEDVADKAEWVSDDEDVATVVNGVVTGQSSGVATITGTYGKKTVTIPVNVEIVKRLEADKKQLSLLLSDTATVKLMATYPDGTTKDVAASAKWSTSDDSVADAFGGVVTAYGSGKATITAEYGSKTATIQVDVDSTRRLEADQSNVFLRLNETKQIKLTATYPDGSTADITGIATWSSNNETVAFVAKGLISAYSSGTATITAKYGNNSINVTVDVEVPRRLEISDSGVSMHVNESKTLAVKATYVDGNTEDVTAKAKWSSSNEDVAFVAGGKISAYAMGEAKVAASYGGKSVSATVDVDVPRKLTADTKSIVLDPSEEKKITLLATYSDGHEEYVTERADWSTSAESVAQVVYGVVTGNSAGTATVSAKYGSRTLTFKTEVGMADKLEPDVARLIMNAKDTRQIVLTATDSTGRTKDVTKEAEWSTSAAKTADVYKGLITATGDGKATVTAKYGGKTATITVEIGVFQKIEANKRYLTLKTGEKSQLTLTVTYSDGSKKDVTKDADWKTSAYKIADVTGGEVEAVSYGKTNITVSYGGSTITIPVEVDTLKYLTTDVVSLDLKVGDKVQVVATATYTDESEQDVSKPALWSSTKILVAEAKDGLIKANGKGSATITVSYGGKKAKVIVTVK